MKIVVFGASGYVGKQLVPHLQTMGHHILVVGRDQKKLKLRFPEIATTEYDNFDEKAEHFDLAINLTTINNNAKFSFDEFSAINRDLMISFARKCREIGVKRFVNFSSIHALDLKNSSFYARSKREGAQALDDLKIENYVNIYIPSVHGDGWAGKLNFLNTMPKSLANFIFTPIAALKPTVNVAALADYLVSAKHDTASPKIVSSGQFENGFYHFTRRIVDICFSAFIMIFFWWLLALLWITIKVDSRGPAIFAQRRIGQNGKEFTCYKFRTMQVGTAQLGTHEVSGSSVTRTGHFLRKLKLDELPQIVNLIKNEMSLIGPRPCLPNQIELIQAREHRGVLDVKPGISGYAQVRNIDMSDPILLANTDATYVGLRGLVLDLKIAFQTALGGGSGDKIAKN